MTVAIAAGPRELGEALVADLLRLRDPVAPQWLMLPGPGVAEGVQQDWARRAGIACQGRVVGLRAALESVASATERPVFTREALALALARILPEQTGLPIPTGLLGSVNGPIGGRQFAWARQLAAALDAAWLCRAEESTRWTEGKGQENACGFLRALAERPEIATLLAGHLGAMSATGYRAAARAWVAARAARGQVPHLWLLLDRGLPELLLARLRDLLAEFPPERVHLYGLEPAQVYWGDLPTGRASQRRSETEAEAGALLARFGRRIQDLHLQAIDAGLFDAAETLPAAPPAPTLLGRLQTSCQIGTDAAAVEGPLEEDAVSFSVHACRSPLRELEVCRDRILQALAEDPQLRPDEILLLLADPPAYAPLVAAALQPQERSEARIPFRLLGLGGAIRSPVAEALDQLIAALVGRLDQAQLRALLEQPLIARRFGLERALAEGHDLLGWLQDAGFRWGLDGAERARRPEDADDPRWSLAGALRRLGLGAVVDPSERDGVVAGAAPLERAAGLATAALAGLARLAEACSTARARWARPQPLTDWVAACEEVIDAFMAPASRSEIQQLTELRHNQLPALARLDRLAGGPALLEADAFRRLLEPLLQGLAESLSQGGGGVTVASLAHYAGTPARMVLIAGLGGDRFPRAEDRPAWHPLATRRRPGDPDRREDDRHHLLLSLLACQQRLVCCYQGGSERDDRPRPPSTPLADLCEAAQACGGDPQRFHLRHGLNGFSPAALRGPVGARSLLAADRAGAAALLRAEDRPLPGLWSVPLPLEAPGGRWRRADLAQLWRCPCRLFLRRCGLLLPEDETELAQGELLALDGLANWRLRERLLNERLRAAQGADERLLQRLQTAGDLPPGTYGRATWDKVLARMPELPPEALQPLAPAAAQRLSDSDGSVWLLEGDSPQRWLRDAAGQLHGLLLSHFDPQRHASALALLQLDLLLLGSGTAELRWMEANKGAWRLRRARLTVPTGAAAQAQVLTLLALLPAARALPLPAGPAIYDAYLGARQNQRAQRQTAAEAVFANDAREAWLEPPRYGETQSTPALLPEHRLCLRGLVEVADWQLPTTVDESSRWQRLLPLPEAPVLIRYAEALRRWQQAMPALQLLDEAAT